MVPEADYVDARAEIARLQAELEAAVVKCSYCSASVGSDPTLCGPCSAKSDQERDDAIEEAQKFRKALQAICDPDKVRWSASAMYDVASEALGIHR
jgi:hypothetical protein